MWARVVYSREWRKFLASLPLQNLTVLEISPGNRPVVDPQSVKHYRAIQFPEFDITKDALSEHFNIIIAEQVLEHVRHPYSAAKNLYEMLKDDGICLIATPFLIKIHGVPRDYTRWTPEGLNGFLEDCGFTAEIRAWGNRKSVKANFARWSKYGWKRDLRNEADFPVSVWAYARKQRSNIGAGGV
jgi:SAM-dependent methyltransferase